MVKQQPIKCPACGAVVIEDAKNLSHYVRSHKMNRVMKTIHRMVAAGWDAEAWVIIALLVYVLTVIVLGFTGVL